MGWGGRATAGAGALRPRQPTLHPLLAGEIKEPKTTNLKVAGRGEGLWLRPDGSPAVTSDDNVDRHLHRQSTAMDPRRAAEEDPLSR